jgi:tetratricopeptide (TPR) repeat protein
MGAGAARNDACACGSGVKYKRCCLPQHEAAAAARARGYRWDADPDAAHNSAIDQIEEGHLDEALVIADRLAQDFPDHPDAHELRARIFEAQGLFGQAAVELRKLRALIAYLGVESTYDAEFFAWLDGEVERLGTVTPSAASGDA